MTISLVPPQGGNDCLESYTISPSSGRGTGAMSPFDDDVGLDDGKTPPYPCGQTRGTMRIVPRAREQQLQRRLPCASTMILVLPSLPSPAARPARVTCA